MQNRLDDMPVGLADMNKLQILKVAGNPLKSSLRLVLESKEVEIAAVYTTDTDKEVALTAELKRYLRSRQPAPAPELENGGETRFGDSFQTLRQPLN
jgi:hypothetical protein